MAAITADTLPRPKFVPGIPFVGNTIDMARDPGKFFYDSYRKMGPAYRINIFGKKYTVIAGAEAAIFMNTRDGKLSLRSKEFWEGLVHEYGATRTLTGVDGDVHKQLRAVMKRGYSSKAIEGRWPELVDITDGTIEREWKPGNVMPVVESMQYFVVEQLGLILTGEAPLDYVKDIRTVILNILNILVTRQRPKIMLLNPKYQHAKKRVNELGQQMIKNYYATKDSKADHEKTLIDDIMEAHLENPELIPEQDLVLTLTGPYVAGLDTVANTMSAFLYLVLKHPDVLKRIQAEVDEVFAEGEVNETTLRNLPTVHGAYMEALRMYPIAVAQMRTANHDFEFEGHLIKKDELLYVATSVPHFMEEYYPEPEKFDVDRYQKPRAEHMKPGAFSPFGRGAHTCLGQSLADVQIILSMARLFHKLDMSLDPVDYTLKTKTAPTPGPAMDFKIKVNGVRN